MKTVKDFYDKTISGWSNEYFNEKESREILRRFVECFERAGTMKPTILDLGCGIGYDTKILNEFGAKTVSIDFSENLIKVAREKLPEYKFLIGDITEPITKLGKFDGTICLATLIHIEPSKMKQTISNIADVLKPGALALLSVFDGTGKNIKKSITKFGSELYDQNIYCYNADELCAFAYPNLKLVDMWKIDDESDQTYYVFQK